MQSRDYESGNGVRDESTDSPSFSASLRMMPGGRTAYSIAGSFETTDTIVFNNSMDQSQVFDTLDPLLNNLEPLYREQEVLRVGMNLDHSLTENIKTGLSCVFQQSTADSDEHLVKSSFSGQSGNL